MKENVRKKGKKDKQQTHNRVNKEKWNEKEIKK